MSPVFTSSLLFVCMIYVCVDICNAQVFFQESLYRKSENVGTFVVVVERATFANSATVEITSTGGITLGSKQLTFAPGVNAIEIQIAVTDDDIPGPDISASLILSNPSGITLGSLSVATILITDDDSGEPKTGASGHPCDDYTHPGYTCLECSMEDMVEYYSYTHDEIQECLSNNYNGAPYDISSNTFPVTGSFSGRVDIESPYCSICITTVLFGFNCIKGIRKRQAQDIRDINRCINSEICITCTVTVIEGDTALVEIVKTGFNNDPVSVQVISSDGTALSRNDYNPINTTVTFLPATSEDGYVVKNVGVATIDDDLVESDEYFYLTLSLPSNNAVLDTPSQLQVVIEDNDLCLAGYCQNGGVCESDVDNRESVCSCTAGFSGTQCEQRTSVNVFSFDSKEYYAFEISNTNIDVTILRSGFLGSDAMIEITSIGNIILTSNEIYFGVDQSRVILSIPVVDDTIPNPDQFATLTLTNPSQGIVDNPGSTATVIIRDNDEFPNLPIPTGGGVVIFEVTLAMTFSYGLYNSKSRQFSELASTIRRAFHPILASDIPAFRSVNVLSFRSGSIVAELEVVLEANSENDATDVVEVLKKNASPTGEITGTNIVVVPGSTIILADLCPTGYCQNGVCEPDVVNKESLCRCSIGYSGTRCDNDNGSLITTTSIVPLAIVLFFIIIIGTASICFLLKQRQRRARATHKERRVRYRHRHGRSVVVITPQTQVFHVR